MSVDSVAIYTLYYYYMYIFAHDEWLGDAASINKHIWGLFLCRNTDKRYRLKDQGSHISKLVVVDGIEDTKTAFCVIYDVIIMFLC